MADAVKFKIRQLYQFLKEANQLRFRPIRTLSDQEKVVSLSEMPSHPSMQLFRPGNAEISTENQGIILTVKRPTITKCLPPSDLLLEWIQPYWDEPNKDVVVEESRNFINDRNETITVKFGEDFERVNAFNEWNAKREAWRGPEIKTRKAMAFFELFYDIHSRIEKDGEDLELVVADGNLLWKTVSENDNEIEINHPILIKRVELRFNPKIPEFTIHDSDKDTELYTSLFADLTKISPASIRNRSVELQNAAYHPLGWQDTEAFLKSTIQTIAPTQGEYLDTIPNDRATTTPRLFRNPVLILRKRTTGIATVVDKIVEDIDQTVVFPASLALITGTENEWQETGLGVSLDHKAKATGDQEKPSLTDDDILLSKESNEEQRKIIRSLERSGSVVVQGPPGTGKTHTIGNLVGHLLAQGKSILITAQTVKALRVVHDKIPEKLKPLAVSVLGSDQNARKQLEISISAIGERLTSETPLELSKAAQRLEDERYELITEIKKLMHKRREALENEYRPIIFGSKSIDPSKAARFVAQYIGIHDWIPSPVKLGSNLSLTPEELIRVYALGALFTTTEERDARLPLPDLQNLPNERQFADMVPVYEELTTKDISLGDKYWVDSEQNSESLAELSMQIANEFSSDRLQQTWRPHAIMAGIHGGTERLVWQQLIDTIKIACEENANVALGARHKPTLSEELQIHQQLKILEEICIHLENDGKLGFIQLATRSEWRQTIRSASVTSGQPTHKDHFIALRNLARLNKLRLELEPCWDNLVGQFINRPFRSLGVDPELSCRGLLPEIIRCLDWHIAVWTSLETRLKEQGFKLNELYAALPRAIGKTAEYLFIEKVSTFLLPRFLEAEINRRSLKECELYFSKIERMISEYNTVSLDQGCLGRIVHACKARNPVDYDKALVYARRLIEIQPLVKERQDLLTKLAIVAPGWSEQIKHRLQPHDTLQLPGDPLLAWEWRQLNNILADRDLLDAQELQSEIEEKRTVLRQLTEALIDAKAWSKQLMRLQENNTIRRALVGWKDTASKLMSTRQPARRQSLLLEARKLMKQSISAVPVWIMPISIMAENFDPKSNKFDVVIIDEASQADLNGLIPLYFAKQIIIVGDHEQVTPLGVGKEQVTLNNLRESMLQDIPNSHLFDNMVSIYDIARQSFGSAIRLVEHFRCVPEIISFSNKLSYEGKIKPLRESDASNIKPSCIPIRVDGIREDKLNKIEARRIVDYIKAMILHPEYDDKTIGIISMLGEPQARYIQSLVHKEISSIEIEKRRIQAGLPSEFQGDERDIIFLTMVDSSSDEGHLRTTGDGAFDLNKKRYNVAVSRARDQIWMIHSFDLINLKSEDLRYQLLQHIQNPRSSLQVYEQEIGKTESPFEKEVLSRLTAAGFKVRTQWEVGYYRIDMVVEGNGKRLAVECDGDRYHPIEKLADDMERQSVLERLGWQFSRIRGSAFFRDPDLAMKPVFKRLEEIGISPEIHHQDEYSTDMTLINELDQLINEGISLLDDEDQVTVIDDANDSSEARIEKGSSLSKLEEVILSYGRPIHISELCKDISIDRGYKALNSNLRRKIELEIKSAAKKGLIKVEDNMVQLS